MRKIAPLITLLGAALLFFAHAGLAQAQATRTWVSGVGDDANPCSRTAPCKTFAGALPKTAAGGEINVLDPGGFGAVTINKSITIRSDHIEAGVLVSGTNAIIVNAGASDRIVLEGLDIEGLGTGLNGVHIVAGGMTTIIRCRIHNFAGNGVNVVGPAGTRVFIENSIITNNTGGVNVQGASGAGNTAYLRNSLVDDNTSFSTQVYGPGALGLIGTTLTGSSFSIIALSGATVVSWGNNVIRGTGSPTQILPLQ
jgi:hypothetical protein